MEKNRERMGGRYLELFHASLKEFYQFLDQNQGNLMKGVGSKDLDGGKPVSNNAMFNAEKRNSTLLGRGFPFDVTEKEIK